MPRPHEGIHYIFDRYSFLNDIMADGDHDVRVSPESDEAQIRLVIKRARAMHHPDKQASSGKSMKARAEEMMGHIADCETYLLNPDLRKMFEQRLEGFQKNKPNLISKSGKPVEEFFGRTEIFDVDSLLSDGILDTTSLEERAQSLTGYSEENMASLQSLFEVMPGNADIARVYRDALSKKLVYLDMLEDMAWVKVGYINRREKISGFLVYSDQYAEMAEEALQSVRDNDIEAAIEQRVDVARIGFGPLPLLITFQGAATTPSQQEVLSNPEQALAIAGKMKEIAQENFDIRADFVRDVARQKQEVLENLVELAIVRPLGAEDKSQSEYKFYLVNKEGRVLFRVDLDLVTKWADVTEAYEEPFYLEDLEAQGANVNSFVVEKNPYISDNLVEIIGAAHRMLNNAEAPKAQPGGHSAPAP